MHVYRIGRKCTKIILLFRDLEMFWTVYKEAAEVILS